ncbi:acyl carrier protein [Parafannyhessea umbonata]|uniref:acyl carrier protein n=1 Tax=Parafannyhessea umbonata TaxID=604330 RepID=UPI0026EE43B5|nr:acyl carrier protein [Parafannyhessea umbonata]MDD6602023.1 acyl carrier protein [Parafannyhessea umbonata]
MSDTATKEEIIDILREIEEDVDYENCTKPWDEPHLDSFDVLQIASAFDDEFDIKIPAKEIVPENFNNAQGLTDMVNRLLAEQDD